MSNYKSRIDIFAKDEFDEKNGFEVKIFKGKFILRHALGQILNYRSLSSDLKIKNWSLILYLEKSKYKEKITEEDIKIFTENKINFYLFYDQKLEKLNNVTFIDFSKFDEIKHIILPKHLDIIKESFGDQSKTIDTDVFHENIINAFKKGWKDSEVKKEKEDLKNAFFGDFLVGGLMTGGLFVIIDNFGQLVKISNVGKIIIGFALIIGAILPWIIKLFLKSEPDKL